MRDWMWYSLALIFIFLAAALISKFIEYKYGIPKKTKGDEDADKTIAESS